MAPRTYHQRVQLVLSDIVKRGGQDILYQRLIQDVSSQFLGQSAIHGRNYERYIRNAVNREVRARRVSVDNSAVLPRINITPSGLRFFEAWGTVPLYALDDPSLRCLNIRQLQKFSAVLTGAIDGVREAFFEFYPAMQVIEDSNGLPKAITRLFESVQNLELQNSELQLELNYEQGLHRDAMAARRHADREAAVVEGADNSEARSGGM
ncbi:hypothetical protein PYCCODRAFT_1472806 [Trametes coccinea BRFM310]|uniref:Uncharacterized protein n=1 Tax=Trametes coccinea (strain BRFM310) TaxID=1353009 RepID=A0A1Y2I8I3_TRAC3|nr:hypothetical protein PYCCODRAFT_1472806 [Trametes coccinea BRFM310]